MTHTVLDGGGVLRYVQSLGAGSSTDPLRLITMSYVDALVDLGKVFAHADRHTIANNGIFFYLIKTPSSPAHVELIGLDVATSSAPIYVDFKETAIVSANGTAETLYNQNRQSTQSPGTLLYLSPTVTDEGVTIRENAIFGEKNIGGVTSTHDRIVLKPATNYLLRIQNVSGANATVKIKVQIGED
jgi:hypothetical protein